MQDEGWDTLQESRAMLDDLSAIMSGPLDESRFPSVETTRWRICLLFYAHVVEMDAPYEVIANLLRTKIGLGFHPSPFAHLRRPKNKKNAGLPIWLRQFLEPSPIQKIRHIQDLSRRASLDAIGAAFNDFYFANIRNAVDHSNFALTTSEFRIVSGSNPHEGDFIYPGRTIPLERLSEIMSRAMAFYSAFFSLEKDAHQTLGQLRNRGFPFDLSAKGILELLADAEHLLNGFKIHWPNERESIFRRNSDGSCEMMNCMFMGDGGTIEFFLGERFRNHHPMTVWVPAGGSLRYTPLADGTPLSWPSS